AGIGSRRLARDGGMSPMRAMAAARSRDPERRPEREHDSDPQHDPPSAVEPHPGGVMPPKHDAATVQAERGGPPLAEEPCMPQPTETPVLDLLATMTASSLEASNLDPKSLMQVRIAALVAVDAPPASYMMNLGAASEMGVDADAVRDVLAAIAPIVGTARTVAALGNIVRAL